MELHFQTKNGKTEKVRIAGMPWEMAELREALLSEVPQIRIIHRVGKNGPEVAYTYDRV